MPREVAAACAGAAVEALRNVRHAGAAHVAVRLTGDHRGLELTVADDGRGFAPGRVRRTALGLRDSVVRRMADVGGTADVRSRPGHGTTVRLRWSAPARDARDGARARPRGQREVLRAAVGDVRGPLAAVCLPYLLVMAVVAVFQTAGTPALSGHLLWYLALAAATCVLIRRADRRIDGRVALPLLAVAVVGAVGCLPVLPAEAVADYRSWPIGAVTPLLTLLVIVRPVHQTVLALVCEEVGIVVLTALDPPGAGSAASTVVMVLPAMLSPATGVVMGLIIRRTLVTLGGAVLDVHRHRTAVVAAESAARAGAEQHRRRLREIDAQIVPFLRSVASGDAPDPAAVRARADRLARSVRDELHLPGVLDGPLRDLVGRAREAGCEVTIHAHAGDGAPPVGTPARAALLRAVLTAALSDRGSLEELVLGVRNGPEGRPSAWSRCRATPAAPRRSAPRWRGRRTRWRTPPTSRGPRPPCRGRRGTPPLLPAPVGIGPGKGVLGGRARGQGGSGWPGPGKGAGPPGPGDRPPPGVRVPEPSPPPPPPVRCRGWARGFPLSPDGRHALHFRSPRRRSTCSLAVRKGFS
ncbi:sensor histidine kinase [Streptomyces somaliensis]|uniref:sensor histidine kinase n=1 Tax=Streptomyces somaliensis TaxID=78355 RepID=UPI0034E96522